MKIKTQRYIDKRYFDSLSIQAAKKYLSITDESALQEMHKDLLKHLKAEMIQDGEFYKRSYELDLIPYNKMRKLLNKPKISQEELSSVVYNNYMSQLNEPITKEWLDSFEWEGYDNDEYSAIYIAITPLNRDDIAILFHIGRVSIEFANGVNMANLETKQSLIDFAKAFKFELKTK